MPPAWALAQGRRVPFEPSGLWEGLRRTCRSRDYDLHERYLFFRNYHGGFGIYEDRRAQGELSLSRGARNLGLGQRPRCRTAGDHGYSVFKDSSRNTLD